MKVLITVYNSTHHSVIDLHSLVVEFETEEQADDAINNIEHFQRTNSNCRYECIKLG